MSNQISNFNGLPTDNSSSTNLKYDLIASKFMTGVENHNKTKILLPTIGTCFGIFGVFIQVVIATVILIGLGLKWVLKKA